ncbi:hypothetical protein [Bacterioplanoides sp.]|uniref:hypothetical protein n=1 Tax=Bacterioplanoides sp. TaxID=2066072 RepID=UPI003B5CAB24
MKVNNINGTSDNSCKCEGWLDHWKKFGGGWFFDDCAVEGCTNRAHVGAHVKKHNSSDNNWYIVPFCHTHNLCDKVLGVFELSCGNVRNVMTTAIATVAVFRHSTTTGSGQR